ncbi:MAG: hypothetical protein GQ531_03085 [Sulfurovum sp.]|nr:hypothetical protein [Sulfurovum sp.]
MYLSISSDNSERSVNFNIQELKFNELPNFTRYLHYSNIKFKDGYRKGENFQGVSVLILDIDDGYSIEEMKKKLVGYKALIVTTKSHQTNEKNGKAITACDRYRLFLPLEVPITESDRYKTIVSALIEEFQADKACKDLARFYYCNPKQEVHFIEGEKYWDISQYKKEVKSLKKDTVKKINKETLIRDEDGNEMSAKDWFTLLEADSVMVHCPLSPKSHKNNDANPSCSMKRKNDYLNMNCFGCSSTQSLYLGEKTHSKEKKKKFIYTVPDINKENVLKELSQGMNTMAEIVFELVRLLPALEKKEKEDD